MTAWTSAQRRNSRAEYARLYKSPAPRHESRVALRRTDVDLIMHLSEQARATRKPGQTLQARLQELRAESGDA